MSDFTPPYRIRTNPGGPGDQPAFPSVIDSSGLQHGEDTVADLFGDSETVKRHAAITASALNAAICAEEMGYDGVRAVSGCDVHIRLLRDALEILSDFYVIDAQTTADEIRSALAQARKED